MMVLLIFILYSCEWVAGLEKKELPVPDAQQDPSTEIDAAPDSVPDPVEECPPDAECCSDRDCTDGCKGMALACEAVMQEASCTSQHGCSWSGPSDACFGQSPACTSYVEQEQCTACGCTWNGGCGPEGAYASACATLSDESACTLCGCGWGAASCSGDTINCNAFHWSQYECEGCGCRWTGTDCTGDGECSVPGDNATCVFCGCSWNPPCTGTHFSCDTCETREDCESQEGCSWSVCRDFHCT
jgi:hypothetical protein